MNFKSLADKREKFSIRKYKSIGAASAVVGILFLASGRVQAAETTPTDTNTQPKDETVNDKIETTKPLNVELQPKVSEIVVTETAAKPVENESTSASAVEKDQPTDKFKMTLRRSSDLTSTDTESVESSFKSEIGPDAKIEPNEKQLNRTNNYNPKWDSVDENGNIIRDLNKYSDPNFTKEYGTLFDAEGNQVENDESSSDKKPDSDTVVETSKPVDESKFEFKTTWEDDSVEDKSGIYNSQSNSLIGTYSGTEVAKNMYVTMKSSEEYEFTQSSASSKVGTLEDGTSVYEISSLNGGSQFEFRTTPARNISIKNNGDSDTFEYKVYNSLTKLNKNNLAEGLSKSKLLYSKELHYAYSGLKQAGYELTDKYESVVKNNVPADDAYRNVNLGIYNSNNGTPIDKFNYVEITTGLNNDAYTTNSKFGNKVYSLSNGIAKVDHDSETITVSGLPDGVTPLADHEDLGNGSYKIKMNDFLNQPHGSTTLAIKYTNEFFKSTFGHNVKIKPDYKIERVNKDGKTFVQVVKDSYDFNLYSKGITDKGEFVHNVLKPANEFEKYSDDRYQPGEHVAVVDANSRPLKMVSNFKYIGNATAEKTLIYSLSGVNSHFTDVDDIDADVYAYSKDKWTYVGKGDSKLNSDNSGYLKLPENSKKVALSYKSLSSEERKPIFKTELDDVKSFTSDTSIANRFLDMNVQIFDEHDAVTYLTNKEIDDTPKTLVDRLLLLNVEKWTYHFERHEYTKELYRSSGEQSIESHRLNWQSNGDSDESTEHPSTDDIYYFAKINKDLLKFNPSFNENTKIVSKKDLSDGSRLYLFKLNNTSNYSDLSGRLSTKLQFDGVSPVNSQIVFGKIDKYSGEEPNNNGFTLSKNKLNYNGDSVDIGQNLDGYNVETSVVNVKFEHLRESFSKLDLSELEPYITGDGKTVYPYELIGSSTNTSDTENTIKTAIMTIPKASGGTILNLREHLSSNDDVTYYYEVNGSGNFVKASNDVNLKDVTKVKVEYSKPQKITVDNPWVWKLPLVLDEKSTSDKTANGYLEFDDVNNEHFVTNSVEVNVPFENKLKNGLLRFMYSRLVYNSIENDYLLVNYLSKVEFKSKPNTLNLKSGYDSKIGDYYYDELGSLGGQAIEYLKTGTDGFVKFDQDKSFENALGVGGHSRFIRRTIKNNLNDAFDYDYILKYVLKLDKNGNYSKLEKTDILNLSEDWTIVPVYELQVKPEFRGYVYRSDVDSKYSDERRQFYNDMIDSKDSVKLLYSEPANTLEHVGDSVTKGYREIKPKVEVEENDRFKRTRTYTYTYHKLNDIDGFKDDGTRTVSNKGISDGADYPKYGLFFYDEHIDEKIEWKTKALTVNYVDADTNKILNTYTVQRLKDEKIGEFDKSYTDYSYVRSDFTESDLMGDSDRAINMYFSKNKATLRTEIYVDDVLVNTVDKTVDTFSPVSNDKPVSTIEYNGKLASYDSTEVENDAKLVGDKDSVTTIKHHYRTISDITSPTVNMIFKDGDTVLGSAIIKSNKSGDKLMWELADSNTSDSFIDGILNRSVYKPADGQDWKPNGQFRTGEVTTTPDKLLYNVEFNVVKKEGRLIISYVDSKTGEKIISDEVYNPVVIGTEYNAIKPGIKLPSKEENVHQNGKLMKRLEFYVKSRDNKIDPVTIKEGDNNVVFKYDKIVKFIDIDVKYNTTVGDVPTVDLPEYTDPAGGNGLDGEGNVITPPTFEITEYTDPIGGNGLDGEGNTIPTPIVEIPEYSGGANPNDAPVYYKPEFDGGVTPNDAPIREIPEYDGPMNSNDSDGEGNAIPTPIVEIPEFNGGVTPNDAPIHELPEFEGSITPNDAPIHELPEFEGGVNPNDAPVHELPELEVPDEPVSPTDPIAPILPHVADHRRADDTPSAAHQNDVPSVETPMNEQNTGSNDQTYVDKSTTAQLPNTGTSSSSSSMLAAGLASAMSAVGLMFAGFKRKKDN